ncbi:hypothetical protein BJ742DRAFT_66854 [Cladochytrium replicatum]|nr:hypothetical protein BJ742DRAFT_66854 [Cladochytrium replicatum]
MLPHREFCFSSTDDFLFDALCATPLMHLPELIDVAAKVAYQGARPRDADNTPVPPLKYFIRTLLERATRCRFPLANPRPNSAYSFTTEQQPSRNTLEATTDANGYSRLDSPFARAIHTTTFLAALVYVDRCTRSPLLADKEGRRGYKSAAHRIFLAALLVASKFNEDPQRITRKTLECFGGPADAIPEVRADQPQPQYVAGIFKNKYWAAYSGVFSVQEVNLMEFQFLSLLDHNLRVTREDIMGVLLGTEGASELLAAVAKRFIAPTVDAATTLAKQHVERGAQDAPAPGSTSPVTRKVRSNTVCGPSVWAAIAADLKEENKAVANPIVVGMPRAAPILSIPPPPKSLPPASLVGSAYSARTLQLSTRAIRTQIAGSMQMDQRVGIVRGRGGSMGSKDSPAVIEIPAPRRAGATEPSRRKTVACFPPSVASVVAAANATQA